MQFMENQRDDVYDLALESEQEIMESEDLRLNTEMQQYGCA